MGPSHSSVLRVGRHSSEVFGSGQTGGESNRLVVATPKELPSPLGKGKGKINKIRYPEALNI